MIAPWPSFVLLLLLTRAFSAPAPEPAFGQALRPLLEHYCLDCHEGSKPKGDVNLSNFAEEATFWSDPKLGERVLTQLQDRVMPPAKKTQPTESERREISAWLRQTLENPDPAKFRQDPGRGLIHRLSGLEFNCTIRDLLGVDTQPANQFPPDGGGGGGFDNNASTLFVPPILMEKYLSAAGELLAKAHPDRLFATRTPATDERSAARLDLIHFLDRAYRRPSRPEEIHAMLALYDRFRTQGESSPDALRQTFRAALLSPNFIFRIESSPQGPNPSPVNEYELACRLSYFLWSSMPDEVLFQLAAQNKLHEPVTLEAQVRRMLADPKSKTFAENFASQWLRTKELRTLVNPAQDRFPQYTTALRDAFYQEPIEFFYGLIQNNRPITECLNAGYTYVNEALAKHYGLSPITGAQMRRVNLNDQNRGGVLGMAGVLTLSSYPRRTSPVLRGKWVMEEILGTPPPPPPPLVNTSALRSEKSKDGQSLRRRLEVHREDLKCAGCHARMDPLGFGLENFDAIGGWRTEIDGAPIDVSGQLVNGQKFSGPSELKSLLMEQKDVFVRNLTEKLLAYALGRGLDPSDWLSVQQIAKATAKDQYATQTLILQIVQSHQFQTRRGSASPPQPSETNPGSL